MDFCVFVVFLYLFGAMRVLCHLNGLVSRLSEAITNANTEYCREIGTTLLAIHVYAMLRSVLTLSLSLVCFADGTNEPLRLIFYDFRTAHTHTHTMELRFVASNKIIRWQQRTGQTNNKTTQPTN